MPTYEYECEKCSLRFELKRRFSENGGASCPRCRGEARRLFSPVPIIFKGSGFYVTDNRDNHTRPLDEDKVDKVETDKKPAKESDKTEGEK